MIIFNMLVKRTLKKEHPFFRKNNYPGKTICLL